MNIFHIKKLSIFFPLLSFISFGSDLQAQAKNKFQSYGIIYDNGNTNIELLVRMSENLCKGGNQFSIGTNLNDFRLRMRGVQNTFANKGYFLNFKMKIIQCDGSVKDKSISISLDKFNKEGINESLNWNFEGKNIQTPIIATIESISFKNKEALIKNSKSVLPSSIEGKLLLKSDESTRLKLSGDGKLGLNAKWVWYENYCGGSSIGIGSSLDISPKKTSTYYVRAESAYDTTKCISVKVTIDDDSKLFKDTKIIAPIAVCTSSNLVTLEVVNGQLGTKANWVWYRDSCGNKSSIVGKGQKIQDVLTKSTTYFVRAEGLSNTTNCLSHQVVLQESITGTPVISGKTEICEGESVSLSLSNQNNISGNVEWIWYSDERFKQKIGAGTSVTVSPTDAQTYFLRGEGYCNNTLPATINIEVKKLSIIPNNIRLTPINKRIYSLTAEGGRLGDGASWNWFNNCDGEIIASGSTIEYKLKKQNSISLRAEGTCNTTQCFTKTFNKPKDQQKKNYTFLNIGIINQNLDNVSITIGRKQFYVRAKVGIKFDANGSLARNSYQTNNVYVIDFPINSQNYYEYNGKKFIKRTSYTGGVMLGAKSFRIYLGGGIGRVDPLWGINVNGYNSSTSSESWAQNITQQRQGVELESGLFLNIGKVNFIGGINLINDNKNGKYIDATFGLGVTF